MNKLNKQQLEQELKILWEQREQLSYEEFSIQAQNLYARFEMRLNDLILHLQEIKEKKGNIKVLKENLYDGTMHLSNIHLQQRKDSDGQFVISIY